MDSLEIQRLYLTNPKFTLRSRELALFLWINDDTLYEVRQVSDKSQKTNYFVKWAYSNASILVIHSESRKERLWTYKEFIFNIETKDCRFKILRRVE